VTLKIENESDLLTLVKDAKARGLPAESIRDAGRTQLTPGTRTVAAIGPGNNHLFILMFQDLLA